ncbi:MAG: hypothetical protein ABII82_09435, partial [Verrucomicrobiota bacterium]
FSIHDTTTNTAYWLSPGQGNQNLRVLEYDDIQHEVIVQRGDETVRLKLSGASIRDSGIDDTGSPLGSTGLVADVNPLNPRLPMVSTPTTTISALAGSNPSKTRNLSGLPFHQLPAFKRRQLTEPAKDVANTSTNNSTADPAQINRGLNPRLWNPSS